MSTRPAKAGIRARSKLTAGRAASCWPRGVDRFHAGRTSEPSVPFRRTRQVASTLRCATYPIGSD